MNSRKAIGTAQALVTLGVTCGMAYAVWRVAAGPDATRVLRMKTAKVVEQGCMGQARLWAGLADRAGQIYEGARAVNG